MMPIAPLMIEHRLIERMVKLLEAELKQIEQSGSARSVFIGEAIDFFRTYADRCHHGKEEDILFKPLEEKPLSAEHTAMLEELVDDHKKGREMVRALDEAGVRYARGENAIADVAALLGQLTAFYPKHIEKEDQHFFLPCMRYFSAEEKDAMLADMQEFDRKLIHEKYRQIVERREKEARA